MPKPHIMMAGEAILTPYKKKKAVNILIVDNSLSGRRASIRFLKKLGYTNVIATWDGESAIEHHIETPFDLILLDFNLSDVDGFFLTHKLRELFPHKNISIIAYTKFNDLSLEMWKELGIDDCIEKPATFEKFKQVIQRVLNKNGEKNGTTH